MSIVEIGAALETALASITPALDTEYENSDFVAPASGPYQRVTLMPAEPDNSTFGDNLRREQGVFQVLLYYPSDGTGSGAALARAELIRSKFTRGSTWSSGGVTVTISHTPSIHPALFSDDRYVIPVRIRYWAYI
jgi:hypothetical protein